MSVPPLATDHSDLLKPGVYILSRHNRVVYVGRTKCLLDAIHTHRSACGSRRLPEWFPIKAIHFDSFSTIPCDYARALILANALIQLHSPVHNLHSSPSSPSTKPAQAPPRSATHELRRL